MRFIFIVQGEGRGHMTQAISLSKVLRTNGHEITRVIIGRSKRRIIPGFFMEQVGAPVFQVDSPNFLTDKQNKSVRIWKSILNAFSRLSVYRRSINQVDRMVKEDEPDVIINFYEFIGGMYALLNKPKCRIVCVAHQYLAYHRSYEFPDSRWIDRKLLQFGNWITSLRANQTLALSFKEQPDQPEVEVVPPLLREEVIKLKPSFGTHLLVYMLNHGYASEIISFHEENPDMEIHCFWDKSDEPESLVVGQNLIFHQLNAALFLELMSSCRGVLTTAGFESVCEGMYFQKPILMVPVKGHFEQACNAHDAVRAGAGISSSSFDLRLLVDFIPKYNCQHEHFRNWCDRAPDLFLQKLTSPNDGNN